MSDAMRDAMRDGKGNSLSPEPCALIPVPPIHASRLTSATSPPVDNGTAAANSDRLAWMAAPRQIGGQ